MPCLEDSLQACIVCVLLLVDFAGHIMTNIMEFKGHPIVLYVVRFCVPHTPSPVSGGAWGS